MNAPQVWRDESWLGRALFILLIFPSALPLLSALNILSWSAGINWLSFGEFERTITFEIVVEIAIIMYLLLIWRDKRYAFFLTRTHLYIFGFGVLLVITALASPDPWKSFFGSSTRTDGVILLTHVAGYVVLLGYLARDSERVRFIFSGAIVLAVASVLAIFFIYLRQLALPFVYRGVGAAIINMAGNTSYFAHYLLLAFFLNLYCRIVRPRRFHIASAMILAVGILATQSSTATGLLGVLCAGWLWWRARRWFYAATAFALFALWYAVVVGDPYLNKILIDPFSEDFIRGQGWKNTAIAVWQNRPWLGFGWGNGEIIQNWSILDSWATSGDHLSPDMFDKAHNVLLEFFAAAGIFGIFALVFFWVRLMVSALKRASVSGDRLGWFFGIAFSAHLAFLFFNFDTLMSWVLMSMLLTAFILWNQEHKRYFIPRHIVWKSAVGVIVVAVSVAGLAINAPALYAYHKIGRHLRTIPPAGAGSLPVSERVDWKISQLRQARLIRQPYRGILVDIWEKLFQLRPYLAQAELRGRFILEMREVSRELIARYPVNAFHYSRVAKSEAELAGDAAAAAQYLNEAIALSPKRGIFRFNLGLLYLQTDKIPEARELFLELKRKERYPGAMDFYLAVADFLEGELIAGKKSLLSALATYDPAGVEWDMLTSAYLVHGKPADLLVWFERISKIVGSNARLSEIMLMLEDISKEPQPE